MAIDFNTDHLPRGAKGWAGLVRAVEDAHPHDENQWIEFKAHLDPHTKEGAATLAKAIVAFANRDPEVAQRWFEGFGVVLVGAEPGKVPGVHDIDPADLENKIGGLLAEPPPQWDVTPISYKGVTVLAITIEPPQAGHPIACIGKSSPKVEDGDIYVRKVGKSERAKSADLRRLEARAANATPTLDGITVEATGIVPVVAYDSDWMERWLATEEQRLLNSLSRPLKKPPVRPRSGTSPLSAFLDMDVLSSMRVERDETRTEEQFRYEVTEYIERCREELPYAFDDLRATHAAPVAFKVTNADDVNYEDMRIVFHVEGDVFGYRSPGDFESLRQDLPRPPRQFGYWTENKFDFGDIPTVTPYLGGPLRSAAPSPIIENGGSVTITSIPMHLRPRAVETLDTGVLVAASSVVEPVRVTWTATATNRNGVLEGELRLPISDSVIDLSAHVRNRDD